jgi:hypothetical protein
MTKMIIIIKYDCPFLRISHFPLYRYSIFGFGAMQRYMGLITLALALWHSISLHSTWFLLLVIFTFWPTDIDIILMNGHWYFVHVMYCIWLHHSFNNEISLKTCFQEYFGKYFTSPLFGYCITSELDIMTLLLSTKPIAYLLFCLCTCIFLFDL